VYASLNSGTGDRRLGCVVIGKMLLDRSKHIEKFCIVLNWGFSLNKRGGRRFLWMSGTENLRGSHTECGYRASEMRL